MFSTDTSRLELKVPSLPMQPHKHDTVRAFSINPRPTIGRMPIQTMRRGSTVAISTPMTACIKFFDRRTSPRPIGVTYLQLPSASCIGGKLQYLVALAESVNCLGGDEATILPFWLPPRHTFATRVDLGSRL